MDCLFFNILSSVGIFTWKYAAKRTSPNQLKGTMAEAMSIMENCHWEFRAPSFHSLGAEIRRT